MPGPDVALTHLLWLRHDEVAFRKEANVTTTRELPKGLSEERLYRLLAYKPTPRRPRPDPRLHGAPYQMFRRNRAATPKERAIGLANARDLRVGLQAEELKAFFTRNGVVVTDEMVRKLASTSRK